MTITKKNYIILKQAALYAAEKEPLFSDSVRIAIEVTEQAAEQASQKTTAYILEKRKKDPNYCR